MRIIAAAFAATLACAVLPVTVVAQDKPPSVGAKLLPGAEPSREDRLATLFETLQSDDTDAAKSAENDIISLWLQSGSDTIDLLMTWTLQAMEAKDYSLALDFLDRITTIKPDYAEGWNKRATVYYLLDDYGKSLADIERALIIEPRHFGALSGLGTMMRDLGDDKRAIEAYRDALALNPHLENVQDAIAEIEGEDNGQDI
jgi:tetratricopeptide (TPR) repeat protein